MFLQKIKYIFVIVEGKDCCWKSYGSCQLLCVFYYLFYNGTSVPNLTSILEQFREALFLLQKWKLLLCLPSGQGRNPKNMLSQGLYMGHQLFQRSSSLDSSWKKRNGIKWGRQYCCSQPTNCLPLLCLKLQLPIFFILIEISGVLQKCPVAWWQDFISL